MKIVTPSNRIEVLLENLLKSKWISEHENDLIVLTNPTHITKEFNTIINQFPMEIIMFVHNDVWLPPSFEEQFKKTLSEIPDYSWGMLGVAGVNKDLSNRGHLNSQGDIWGRELQSIEPIYTLDELLLIRNSYDHGIRFDENIKNHHLFGADYCLQCIDKGLQNYVGEMFVYHNSTGSVPDEKYNETAGYISEKWNHMKPFGTTSRYF